MLHRERQVSAGPAQIEIGIAEGVQIGRSTETLAGVQACGHRLAGVMHEHDGEVEASLQIAYAGQPLRHLGGVVLVDRVQSDPRIEEP